MEESITIPAKSGHTLFLGRQGENLARQITFDLSPWLEAYGEGRAALAVMRSGDDLPYPASDVRTEGDTLIWSLTAADTERAGYGKCELRWYVDDVLAKSELWMTLTAGALGKTGETPAPAEDYIAAMQRIGNAVQEAQTRTPQIGENGNWQIWDAETEAYTDTGQPARGEQGQQGVQGEPSPVPPSAWVHKPASGAVIVLQDGAADAPAADLTVSIPYASGGYTGATVFRTGKNLLPTALPNTWKHLTMGNSQLSVATNAVIFAIPVPRYATICVQKRHNDGIRGYLALGDTADLAAGTPIYSGQGFTNVEAVLFQTGDHEYLYIETSSMIYAQRWFTERQLMVSIASARQEYAAPKDVIAQSISWRDEADTVYGGTLDMTNGVLTATLDENGQPLADPSVYAVQSAALDTLDGWNTVWADCGTMKLTYCADATLTDGTNARKAMLASAEVDMIATRNYTVGELLIAGETLYTATANIASGSAITPGVNVSETTVAAQLALAAASGGGGSVTVDSALSATSTNPVQNKAIKAALDGKGAAASIPASASVDANGLISFKNADNTQLFTVQLPLYAGGVS